MANIDEQIRQINVKRRQAVFDQQLENLRKALVGKVDGDPDTTDPALHAMYTLAHSAKRIADSLERIEQYLKLSGGGH